MTVTKLTPKQLRDRMRKLAADMLKYDLANLTPAQNIRLDRAASFMLELDDLQSKQLAGLPFDARQYVVVSESFERMLGGDPSSTASVESEEQMRERLVKEMFSKDAEALAQLLHRRIDARERRAASLEAEAARRNEQTNDAPAITSPEKVPVMNNQEPSSPVAEIMPENFEPPKSNVQRASYIDYAVLEPSPRHASLNNPSSRPAPATQRPTSPATQSFFSDVPAAGGLGPLKRGDDWLPKRNF